MGQVVDLQKIREEYIEPERILESVNGEYMDFLLVIGIDKDGGDYFACSHGSAEKMLFEIELFKQKLLQSFIIEE